MTYKVGSGFETFWKASWSKDVKDMAGIRGGTVIHAVDK
jgi:hypothetical protein